MLLAIDPGTTTGWALFSQSLTGGGELLACGLNTPPQRKPLIRAVIERPVIYPGGRTKNPNDVLSVAVSAGEWGGWAAALGASVQYVTPSQWKGQTKKDIQHARDWAQLNADEQAIVSLAGKGLPASKRHNMLDAIGIGLWALGRSLR